MPPELEPSCACASSISADDVALNMEPGNSVTEKLRETTDERFNRVMSAINRKQVPLCGACHDAVHAGKYDGHRLSDLAYVPP